MIQLNLKKVLLISLLLINSVNAVDSTIIYKALDKIGYITDPILTRGELSPKHKKMFEEVSEKLNIDYRQIKARNTGIIPRLLLGYQNAMAMPQTNRVYLNQDCLNELDDEAVKFLMGHELTHHNNHHIPKTMVVGLVKGLYQPKVKIDQEANSKDSFIKKYLTYGLLATKRTNSIIINAILGIIPELSIWNLAQSQFIQYQETEADREAVIRAGVDPEAGVRLMEHLYFPDGSKWPIYAKILVLLQRIFQPILSLPVLKQHGKHLTSFKDRIEYIKSLKPEWQKMQAGQTVSN